MSNFYLSMLTSPDRCPYLKEGILETIRLCEIAPGPLSLCMNSFDCIAPTIDADTASQVMSDCLQKTIDHRSLLTKWLQVILNVLTQSISDVLVKVGFVDPRKFKRRFSSWFYFYYRIQIISHRLIYWSAS